MEHDERKGRLHIHLGGLVILIIVALVLFKVDITSKIQSPQFQKNLSYIEDQATNFWQTFILNPLKSRAGDWFNGFTNKELQSLQDNFSKNVLKETSPANLDTINDTGN